MAEEQPLILPPTTTDSECKSRQDPQRLKLNERNRAAAFKYRQKKKQWIQDQERKSKEVIARNRELHTLVSSLRKEVMKLRYEILDIGNCNCPLVQTYIQKSSAQLLGTSTMTSGEAAASTIAEILQRNTNNQKQQYDLSPPGAAANNTTTTDQPDLYRLMPQYQTLFATPLPP